MIKKSFSLFLITSILFTPCGFTEESDILASRTKGQLDKVSAEAARSKELLEIWKDHVRTLTQERDEAYHEIETLKSGKLMAQSGKISPAHFGGIETQALPPNAMMPVKPLPTAATANVQVMEQDIQSYQGTIRELRGQLSQIQTNNQRIQKEIMEAGNDKTLIIKDKEQGVEKIEALSKQVMALKSENERLNNLLRQASSPVNAPLQTAVSTTSKAIIDDSQKFLQNAFNAQSVRLKKITEENEDTIRRADELQRKYVDLQASFEKLKNEKQAGPAAVVPPLDLTEINRLKSQNIVLKNDLDKQTSQLAQLSQVQFSSAAANKELESLQMKIEQNEMEIKNLKLSLEMAKKESSHFSESATQVSQMQREINQLKASKDSDVQELVNAKSKYNQVLAQQEKMKYELESLKSQTDSSKFSTEKIGQLENENKSLQSINSEMTYKMKRRQEAMDQILENLETARAENKKLLAEKVSHENDRLALRLKDQEWDAKINALAADKASADRLNLELRQEMDDLKNQNQKMKAETEESNERFKSLEAKKAAESDQVNSQLRQERDDLVIRNQKMKEEVVEASRLLQSIQVSKAAETNKIESLKSQISAAELAIKNLTVSAEALRSEKENFLAQNETMKKAMVDLEREAQSSEDRAKTSDQEINQLRNVNTALQQEQQEQLKTIETLKASLKQSLDDVQNLKNNFQSYLESMVTSFEDRQKKGTPVATS